MKYTKDNNFVVGFSSYQRAVKNSPVYPISDSLRAKLTSSKEPMIEVYVGSGDYHELVSRVPAAVLDYFAPKHRASQPGTRKTTPLELRNCCKHAVQWIMNWMVHGGVEKNYKDTSILTMSATDRLLNRLQVVTEFEIGGDVYKSLCSDFMELIITGTIAASQLIDIFGETAPLHIKGMCKDLAWTIVENVLDGAITTPVVGASQVPLLAADIRFFLGTKINRLHVSQRVNGVPISIFQLRFLYKFTDVNSLLRRKAVHDLLDLMDGGYVEKSNEYKQLAADNEEFGGDLNAATIEKAAKEKARANERDKAAAVRAQARVKTLVREIVQESATKKQSDISRTQPQKVESSDPGELNSESAPPRRRGRKHAAKAPANLQARNDLSSAPEGPNIPADRKNEGIPRQQAAAVSAQNKAENSSTTKSKPKPKRKSKAKGVKASESSVVTAAIPAAAPTSGQRLSSTAVPRIGSEGNMEREK